MNFTLDVKTKILAYADSQQNNNPRLRAADWFRESTGLLVSDPKSEGHVVGPGASKTVFDGTRSTTIDGTTTFSIALSEIADNYYRITHTSGTSPGFRTDRGLTLNGAALTFAVNTNATVTLTTTGLFTFSGIVAGDVVFFPNTTTGDASSPVNPINCGYWQVLGVTSSQNITLVRLTGAIFEGLNQTVTLTANSQMQAFTSTGVQVGDSVDISAGFSSSSRRTFYVSAVTAGFIEIHSSVPLVEETGIQPGAAGMAFYTDGKQFVYIETDQEATVRLNGDSSSNVRLSPLEAGNPDKPSMFLKVGPSWSLVVVNRTSVPMNVLVIHAEGTS